jgi:hypothetical protein
MLRIHCCGGKRPRCSFATVDPIQLYITILSMCYVHLSNKHTLSSMLQMDLSDPEWLQARIQDVVLCYLNSPSQREGFFGRARLVLFGFVRPEPQISPLLSYDGVTCAGMAQGRNSPRPGCTINLPSAQTTSPREIVYLGQPLTTLPSYGV